MIKISKIGVISLTQLSFFSKVPIPSLHSKVIAPVANQPIPRIMGLRDRLYFRIQD